jgi:hypothetical protein
MAEQLERARRVLTMPPEKAGEMIVRQVERRTPRVVIGGQAKMSALIERLAPVSYWKRSHGEKQHRKIGRAHHG